MKNFTKKKKTKNLKIQKISIAAVNFEHNFKRLI